ncbi:uracil-xanthine permease family protein [Parapedobacter sp. GCM10030251]|uniref:uracil-xanthine permease family protein n=1 Tax=Parapedobacter sp. GCM10030251 TaxID=3273419 RepID=UPI0036216B8F
MEELDCYPDTNHHGRQRGDKIVSMMAGKKKGTIELEYGIDDRPRSGRDWIVYTLQYVVTMIYAVVWGYAIVGIGMGFESAELSGYMSSIVVTIGLSTLIQAWLGHRMAMVSGPNIIPSLAIVAAITAGGKEYAQQAFLAQAIAGIVVIALALLGMVKFIKRIWSPLILGVMVVGLSISKQGLILLTASGFGWQFFAAMALALVGIFTAIRAKGTWGTLSAMIVIIPGYLIFMISGNFQWELLREPSFFIVPQALPYGIGIPPLDLIAIMIIVNLMAVLNMFGNLTGYADVVGHTLQDSAMKRSFLYFGSIETCLAGLLGVPATVAYGENLGIVMLTRVAARSFIIAASLLFVAFAFIGPVGGFMAAMPEPVAGAVLLGIASTVIGIGAGMMATSPDFGRREQSLVGFSVFLSLGLFLLPQDVWKDVPRIITTLFSNPIVSVIIFVMVFEQLIFRQRQHRE